MSTYRILNPKPGIYTTKCPSGEEDNALTALDARARVDGYTRLMSDHTSQMRPGPVDVCAIYLDPTEAGR